MPDFKVIVANMHETKSIFCNMHVVVIFSPLYLMAHKEMVLLSGFSTQLAYTQPNFKSLRPFSIYF